jgi:hypothetical protein
VKIKAFLLIFVSSSWGIIGPRILPALGTRYSGVVALCGPNNWIVLAIPQQSGGSTVEFIEQLALQPSEGSSAVQQLEEPTNRKGKGGPWKKG